MSYTNSIVISGKYRPVADGGVGVFGLELERWTPQGSVYELITCEAKGELADRISRFAKNGTRIEIEGSMRPSSQRVAVVSAQAVFSS